jgi:DNA polymerase-3 subunit alpha
MIHLHNHTARGSLLDSILTPEQMIKFAKNNNQNAIALTDHGKMHEFVNFYKLCVKEDIKPIIGCEIYEVIDVKNDKENRYHLILLAKNKIGLLNLFKIVSDACVKFHYYKPIIDLNYIEENNLGKGIICLTACQAGRLSRCLVQQNDMIQYYNKLNKIFDYTTIELQSHETQDQVLANKVIWNFIQKHNLPFIITCDSHMLNKEDQEVHSIFIEINANREVGESYTDCYLQTESEIHKIMDKQIGYEAVEKAFKESHKIADMIELINIGLKQNNQMPDVSKMIPTEYKSTDEYFDHLINEGFKKREHNKMPQEFQEIRKQRLKMEKLVLKELDYIDYFIMCNMLAEEMDKRKIPRNYGRGSGGNCLSFYYLYVTHVDSVKWDLDFSRFANLGRRQPADFDWDISRKRRKEAIQISKDLFYEENVAPICTFNSMSTKVAIRDIRNF